MRPHSQFRRPEPPPAKKAGIIRPIILFCFIIVLVLASFIVYRHVAGQQLAAVPEVRSAIDGYCLDDYHDRTAVNAVVDTWDCNGSAAQDWTITSDAIKHKSTQCLDVENNGTTAGDPLVLNPCNGSPGQMWTINLSGFENPNSGLCLSTPSNNQTKQQLVVESCNNLADLSEGWTADTWTASISSSPNCNSGSEGQRVACYAERQWAAWQASPSDHEALLNDYTDGNAYEEWCADFVSYVYREAGYPFTNGERDNWDEYDADNIQYQGLTMHNAAGYTPQPGDIAYFDYPGGHVEIVVTGGAHPTFIYGDSNTTDPATNNGEMNKDSLTSDGSAGQVMYYFSPA